MTSSNSPVSHQRLAHSHVPIANQIVYAEIAMKHTDIYQVSPDPFPCEILKAIYAGVSLVWLVRLLWTPGFASPQNTYIIRPFVHEQPIVTFDALFSHTSLSTHRNQHIGPHRSVKIVTVIQWLTTSTIAMGNTSCIYLCIFILKQSWNSGVYVTRC